MEITTHIPLRRYQEAALGPLTGNPRFILGDDAGLGKTFPTIHAAKIVSPDKPKLIVVPAYLMYQWEGAIKAYLGEGEHTYVMERAFAPVPADYTGWVMISYHTLTNAGVKRHPELVRLRWGAVVFDEAHRLRGRKNQWTRNAKHLKTDYLWMLTGTPLVNNPGDIWPILNIMQPKDYTSYWRFVEEWCTLEYTPWATKVGGIKKGLEDAFYAQLQPLMLRRKIEDHLPEIPAKIEHFIPVKLSDKVLKAHRTMIKDWIIENPDLDVGTTIASGGALVTFLRKLTAGILPDAPVDTIKLDTVCDILSDHADASHVVFTWFKDTAHALRDKIIAAGQVPFLITGDVPAAERERRIRVWQETPNAVIVATMASMQEGVNLQKAESVIFAETYYLPAMVEQAIARVRRFGQTKPVNVYYVYAQHTVDETVWRIMHGRHTNVQKALLEDLVLTGLPVALPKLTTAAS